MKKRTQLLLLIAFIALVPTLKSQDLRSDLLKMYQKMDETPFQMELEMEIHFVDSQQGVVKRNGVIKKAEESYYTHFDNQVQLSNANFNIMVLEQEKKIVYTPISKEQTIHAKNPLEMMKDTALLKEGVVLKANTSLYREYEINAGEDKEMEKMTMRIGKNNSLQQITYYYKQNESNQVQKVIINYNNLVFNPSFDSNTFSEQQYFTVQNKNAQLSNAYKNYTLVYEGY